VEKGEFREDLFYRINVFKIRIPPLRERVDDIPVLANHLLSKFNRQTKKAIKAIRPEALQCLSRFPFPGNVRQLENEIKRAITMADDGQHIEVEHLSEKIRAHAADFSKPSMEGTLKEMVGTLEKKVLMKMMEKHRGNRSRMARELGLSRQGLTLKMKRYSL
jgi:transcriptional regulator with PAS, ATPase and Fis domain